MKPLADVVLYVEAPMDAVVREVPGGPASDLAGSLDEVLDRFDEGYLVVPTTSPWTAVLRRSSGPEDLRPLAGSLPASIGCRTVLVYASDQFRTYGFVLADAEHNGMLDAVRVLLLADGEVQTMGEPLPAEQGLDPSELDLDRLDHVLRSSFGIAAFDEGFYLPPGTVAVRT